MSERGPNPTKKENEMYDQELHAAHGLCYETGPDDAPRWFFDFGVTCEHPEWHGDRS